MAGWDSVAAVGLLILMKSDTSVIYTLIGTAKLNDIDAQAWLAD